MIKDLNEILSVLNEYDIKLSEDNIIMLINLLITKDNNKVTKILTNKKYKIKGGILRCIN